MKGRDSPLIRQSDLTAVRQQVARQRISAASDASVVGVRVVETLLDTDMVTPFGLTITPNVDGGVDLTVPPGPSLVWGDIGGLLADQTDLATALNGKQPTITAGTTAQYYRGDKTFQTLDKAAVGLGNVDNTTDAAKPVSTAQSTAIGLKLNATAVSAYGLTLIDDADAATARSTLGIPVLDSGTYTPTLTNVANLDGSTAYVCQYLRVGDTVTVSGRVGVDPTVGATATRLGITLPIASNFADIGQCGGTAIAPGVSRLVAAILADTANDRAQMEYITSDTTNQSMYFSFTYRII